jgi:hypothetical protein
MSGVIGVRDQTARLVGGVPVAVGLGLSHPADHDDYLTTTNIIV